MPGALDQNLNQRPFSAKWISNYNTGGPIAINSVKWINLYDNYTFRSMPGDLDQNLNQRSFSAKWISNYNAGGPIAINSDML